MSRDLARFVNALRAVFGAAPLYHDGRSESEVVVRWWPESAPRVRTPSRRGSDKPYVQDGYLQLHNEARRL